MKKYIASIVLIVVGGFISWYGKTQTGRGINPIGGLMFIGGIGMVVVGVIIGIIKATSKK